MATIGLRLLVVDVLLPVPASLVMIASGAAFGIVGGALLALAGSVAATLLAFWIGRSGGPRLDRFVPAADRARFDRAFDRWGDVAVVATRPVPIIAETVAVMAGTTPLGWRRTTLAAALGALPAAVLSAAAGSATARLDNGALVFGLVILLASLLWGVGMWLRRSSRHAAAHS